MPAKRTRHNGEGSIYPYRNGWAAFVWVEKPDGTRDRKYVYGKARETVHDKWIKLQERAKQGLMSTKAMTLGKFVAYWLEEIVEPNLAPGTYVTYEGACRNYIVPGLGSSGLTGYGAPMSRRGSTWCAAPANAALREKTSSASQPRNDAVRLAGAATLCPRLPR
jgi:hypothetical protein